MLLIVIVHVVLQFIREPGELVIQVVDANVFVFLRRMDFLRPLVDVADKELDAIQWAEPGLAHFLDLLLRQRVFARLSNQRTGR